MVLNFFRQQFLFLFVLLSERRSFYSAGINLFSFWFLAPMDSCQQRELGAFSTMVFATAHAIYIRNSLEAQLDSARLAHVHRPLLFQATKTCKGEQGKSKYLVTASCCNVFLRNFASVRRSCLPNSSFSASNAASTFIGLTSCARESERERAYRDSSSTSCSENSVEKREEIKKKDHSQKHTNSMIPYIHSGSISNFPVETCLRNAMLVRGMQDST